MDTYVFAGEINSNHDLVWVTQTKTSDGVVSVTEPDTSLFEVDADGTSKVDFDWDDIVTFSHKPAVLLTVTQSSKGNGSLNTATVMDLTTADATVQVKQSDGDGSTRGFSFLISGVVS